MASHGLHQLYQPYPSYSPPPMDSHGLSLSVLVSIIISTSHGLPWTLTQRFSLYHNLHLPWTPMDSINSFNCLFPNLHLPWPLMDSHKVLWPNLQQQQKQYTPPPKKTTLIITQVDARLHEDRKQVVKQKEVTVISSLYHK